VQSRSRRRAGLFGNAAGSRENADEALVAEVLEDALVDRGIVGAKRATDDDQLPGAINRGAGGRGDA